MILKWVRRAVMSGFILLTAVSILVLPEGLPRQHPTFLLLWVWPALSWYGHLDGDPAERFVLASGRAFLINMLLVLLLHYLPGAFPMGVLLGVVTAHALLPLFWGEREKRTRGQEDERIGEWVSLGFLVFLLVVMLAGALRLGNMGYKEIQGDEGVLLVRAAAMLTGDDAELFLHQKGPAEILLPLATWSLTGRMTEFWGRLPFTWASILSVVALFALVRRWFGARAAVIAAALLAIMGFSVAFGRIMQYQSLVLLWGVLAVLAAVRYADSDRPRDFYQAGWFLAAGLLAHYDTILFAPAVGVILLLADVKRRPFRARLWLYGMGSTLLIMGVFYLPFALNENFGRTVSYLLNDRVGVSGDGSLAGGSWADVWRMLTFYNSTYYIIGLALLGAFGLSVLPQQKLPTVVGMLTLWLVPLLFYTLIVTDPRTHVYTIFPGVLVLAGLGGAALLALPSKIGRWTAAVAFSIWFVVSAWYIVLLFTSINPEYQRTWAENRPRFYWTTWSEPPQYGLFGFPYQAGWRTAGAWLEKRDGWYAANEEEEVTNWYMGQAPRTHCPNFETFIWTAHVQDEVMFDETMLEGDKWHVQAVVAVDGRSTMRIFGRKPVAAPLVLDSNLRPRWLSYEEVAPPRMTGEHEVGVVLGERVRLLGYDIDKTTAAPGEQVTVVLYWEALRPFERNYQSFVHLYDGEMYGQNDHAPECGHNPTTRWEPGQIIPDPHVVTIGEDAPAGELPVLVGMYDLLSVERLGNPADARDVVEITRVEVVR